MLRFRLLTVFFLIGLSGVFFGPWTGWENGLCGVIWSLLYVGLAGWGSYQIRSQLYVRTWCRGDRQGAQVALTFDDGPDPERTPKLLEVLKQYQARATFFMIGQRAAQAPELTRRILTAGHQLGNHSFSHTNGFPLWPANRIQNDIEKAQQVFEHLTGQRPAYFRPPFGVTNPLLAKALKNFSFQVIGWSLRSLDTRLRNEQQLIAKIIRLTRPGEVILLHDTTPGIERIVAALLGHFEKKGWQAVTIAELLASPVEKKE